MDQFYAQTRLFMMFDPLKTVKFSKQNRLANGAYHRNPSEILIRKLRTLKKWNLGGLALPFMLLASPVMAATFVVTSLSDSGPGSLRAAITSANANKGSTITFSTTGTITLSTPLPSLVAQMVIDGTTAPDFAGTPLVSVDFNTGPGFTVAAGADDTSIKSLALVHAQNGRGDAPGLERHGPRKLHRFAIQWHCGGQPRRRGDDSGAIGK
jgi:hypothetical protein